MSEDLLRQPSITPKDNSRCIPASLTTEKLCTNSLFVYRNILDKFWRTDPRNAYSAATFASKQAKNKKQKKNCKLQHIYHFSTVCMGLMN